MRRAGERGLSHRPCGRRIPTVLGNLLVGPQVLDAMYASDEVSSDHTFPARLLLAAEAGLDAGGGGVQHLSPTVVVAGSQSPRPLLDLRVDGLDAGGDAIAEPRRSFDDSAPLVDDGSDYWLDHAEVTPERWLELGSPTSR